MVVNQSVILRIPVDVVDKLKRKAAEEQRSFNRQAVYYLEKQLQQDNIPTLKNAVYPEK